MNLRKLGNLGKILNKSGTARGSLGDHSGCWKALAGAANGNYEQVDAIQVCGFCGYLLGWDTYLHGHGLM